VGRKKILQLALQGYKFYNIKYQISLYIIVKLPFLYTHAYMTLYIIVKLPSVYM